MAGSDLHPGSKDAFALNTPIPSMPGTPGGTMGHHTPNVQSIRRHTAGHRGPLQKILVANRGEIACRVFRTAHELAMHTVAIYSHEDRMSAHRHKADEAYMVGKGLTPVGAYLAQDDIIKLALEHGVDMIHPGYGFLAENAEFAKKVEEAGLAFIGPQPEVIDGLGDKVKARTLGDSTMKCGVPVVPGTEGAIASYDLADAFIKEHGFPVIIKAAMGGGGRGMRVVRAAEDFKESFERAVSEAKAAFGDGTVFIERFLDKPRHIEVQLLGDSAGNILEDAKKLASAVNYRNAGTAEFLVDQQGRHHFIEINPRIQVEHTITEEITGIDIVAAQIQIAAGATLPDLGLTQDAITKRGYAIQCRVTTEDPAANFQPDTGKIEVYRSAGGNGVRLDASSGFAGAQITPHYDSLLTKVTVRGATFEIARRKMLRALVEFRIRGVKTNIPFLFRVLSHETFVACQTWTTFIDDTPALFHLISSQNRAQKLLGYLGDLVVNGSSIKGQQGEPGLKEEIIIPQFAHRTDPEKPLDVTQPSQFGWRAILKTQGPAAFAKAVRDYKGCLIMDTTWRDAHQSLLATRLRTIDILNIARETSHALANAYSLECWGGATFDVAMRFLYEDPWERLRKIRKLVPNIPLQALIRGANAVGYTSYPDNAIYEFSKKAVENGLDIFRVFDSLNYLENMKLGIDAAKRAGGVVEATICYTGDVADPKKTKYTLDYYMNFAAELVASGNPCTCDQRYGRIINASSCKNVEYGSIHLATMLQCAESGADVVDCAIDSMSGMTSQCAMGALCAALEQNGLGTGIRYDDVQALNLYWSQCRMLYSCFDANVKASDSGVYEHEMPGGQYTNLMFQSQQLGLGTQWAAVKKAYIEANQLCGDIVKVTPSSKVVGDFAQFLVSNKLSKADVEARADKLDFPNSVVEFFQGYLGQPVGGFPEPLRIEGRPGISMAPYNFDKIRKDLQEKFGKSITSTDVLSYCMYPKVYEEFKEFLTKYGDLSILPSISWQNPEVGEELHISIEQGKTLIVKLLASGPVNPETGVREVFFELNGETRAVQVEDRNAAVETAHREKATSDPGSVGSPMAGVVVEIRVQEGHEVKAGDPICIMSAMKMEQNVTAPVGGKVSRVAVGPGDSLGSGDLIVEICQKVSNIVRYKLG
ncbi:hypothetical protein DFH28DRAFT_926723 [Melampsora americana]|nr:hypothetical protein DFH28DRAFT_926723 [Melampsora americana]